MISFIRKGILIIMACVGGIIGGCESKKVPLNKEQFREKLRRERAVELAYEDHRFWDVRRWMIAPETLGKPLKGVEITRAGSSFSYNVINVENRTFQNRMYFYPIPQKDLNIVGTSWPQNPMW